MATQDTKRIEEVWDEKGNLPTNAIVATAAGKIPALDGSLITDITASQVDFGTGTDGYVWTSDGAGSEAWEALAGGGDMLAATYDPTAVSGDAFAMDNMVEGTTTKILTGAERTKLSGIETAADVTDETNVVAALDGATLTDVGTPASTDRILLQDASDSNNLKYADFSEFSGGGGGGVSFDDVTLRNAGDETQRDFVLNYALNPQRTAGLQISTGFPWGTATSGTGSTGEIANYARTVTGTTSGSWSRIYQSIAGEMDRQYPFGIGFTYRDDATPLAGTSKIRVYIAYGGSPSIGSDPATYAVGFQLDSTGIQVLTHDGTTLELTDTSYDAAASDEVSMRVMVDPRNGGDVYWAVDANEGTFEKTGFSRTTEQHSPYALIIENTNGDQSSDLTTNWRKSFNHWVTANQL